METVFDWESSNVLAQADRYIEVTNKNVKGGNAVKKVAEYHGIQGKIFGLLAMPVMT